MMALIDMERMIPFGPFVIGSIKSAQADRAALARRAGARTKLCRSMQIGVWEAFSKYRAFRRINREARTMATQMTKSQLIEKIAAGSEVAKKDVKGVLETLASVGYKELKKSGVFLVPGFAKFVVIKKPATKARQGTNPFTGEPMMFKAKPARKIVRARPVKAAKDAV
jgi:DNA-binding protein HU-beta